MPTQYKIIITTLLVLPFFANAQFSLDSGSVSLRISPEFPGAFTNVNVTVEGLGIDLDRSKISWFLNEQISKTGIGEKNFSFKTGAMGVSVNLIVTVETIDGAKINSAASITPAEVSLVWEPVAYAPPFYKGKRLYTYESPIRVIAIPEIVENGRRLASDELVFKWKENYKLIQSASGSGKDTITVRNSVPLKPIVVSVEISTLNNSITATGDISAEPDQPQILFYENSPLYGILWNRALTSPFALAQKEIAVLATPYFFGVQNAADPKLQYTWTLNGAPVSPTTEKNILTLRQESEQTGTALLGLRVANTKGIFQFSDGSLSIELGKKPDTGFFGF